MWVFTNLISHDQIAHWAMYASADTHFGRTVWPFLISTATSSVHSSTDVFWQWNLLQMKGKDFTVILCGPESHRGWAFPCPWSPITLPWLDPRGLWLVGEVSGTLISDVFFQIQGGWQQFHVNWRELVTDRESGQRSWNAAWWIFMRANTLRAKRITLGETLQKFGYNEGKDRK